MDDAKTPRGTSSVPPRTFDHNSQSEDHKIVGKDRRDSIESKSSDTNSEPTHDAHPRTCEASDKPPVAEQASTLKSSHSSVRSAASSINSGSLPKAIFTPETPVSGIQTPAACRPLTRRLPPHENRYRSTRQRSLSEPNSEALRLRSRSRDTLKRLEELRDSLAGPRLNTTPPSPEPHVLIPDASSRPPQPPRRISEKVAQDTRSLRQELEELREGLSNEEVARQRELIAVNFAVNRILEMQKSQMQIQDSLIDRFVEMDLELKKNGDAVGVRPSNKYGALLSPKSRLAKNDQEEPRSGEGQDGLEGKEHWSGESKPPDTKQLPKRTRVYEEDSDIEPDSPVEESSLASDMDQPSQNGKAERSEVNRVLADIANRTTHEPPPPHLHQRLHDKDSDKDDEDLATPPPPPPSPPKSQGQIDAEQLAKLDRELWWAVRPFNAERHGQIVSELREFVKWHQEESQKANDAGHLGESLRHQSMEAWARDLLNRAYLSGRGRAELGALDDVKG